MHEMWWFMNVLRLAILCAIIVPQMSQALTEDRFWQIQEYGKAALSYWRTSSVGDKVEIHYACNPKSLFATAVGTNDKEWVLSPKEGELKGVIKRNGQLVLTTNKGPWGTGQRIEPVTCGDHGLPVKVVNKSVALGEQTLAVEEGEETDGYKHLEASRGATLIENRSNIPQPSSVTIPDQARGYDTLTCRSEPTPETIDKSTQGLPILGSNSEVWPGNLIRAKAFRQGTLSQVTAGRAGGGITVTGLNFAQGGSNSRKLPVVTKAVVERAIASLLNQKVESTEAEVAFTSASQVYSNDQMAFVLGVDGRFANGISQSLPIDEKSRKNYVLLRFVQTYYHVSFDNPETSYSVFREKERVRDPDNQMAADDPPMYISDVQFGRGIYFLVSSDAPAENLIEALNMAGGKTAADSNKEASYRDILARASASYYVSGGDSISTLGPLGAISDAGNLYDKIKKVIADEKNAQVTKLTKGRPVAYTVNYLTSRSTATMRFATNSNRTSCTLVKKELASFEMTITCRDDDINVRLFAPNGSEIPVFRGRGQIPPNMDVSGLMTEKGDVNYVLSVALWNDAGPSCADFILRRVYQGRETYLNGDSQMVPRPTGGMPGTRLLTLGPIPYVHTGGSWYREWISDARWRINRFTGAVSRIQ